MAQQRMNRRRLLKTGAVIGGMFTFAPSGLSVFASQPIRAIGRQSSLRFTEAAISREFPELKARLFANENPFGPSPKAKQAIVEAIDKSYQYPIVQGDTLLKKIAERENLTVEQVAISAGSTAMLHAAASHFSQGGGEVISGDPSYDDLPTRAELLKGVWTKTPLKDDFTLNLDDLEKSITGKTALVYICNPNNPTGTVLDAVRLREFCVRVSKKVPVLIDEAYVDYLKDSSGSSMMSLVREGHNVIIARTFSKLYGFAGLRVGYMVAQKETLEKIKLYIWPEASLSATSLAAALATFGDTDFLVDAASKTEQSKQFLYNVLKKEGYEYIPSSTNFVMFPVNIDAERFTEEMMKRSVGVRPWKFGNKNWCRVSIGTMSEMEEFEKAFKQIS